jgi:hypothetical protein
MTPWPGYALAVVATAATLCARIALDTQLGGRPTLILFVLPILLSAYQAG